MKYTFGLFPLQQYLIDIDNGRIQSLDHRLGLPRKADGGQRWFSLYPGEKILPGESIHWTGRDQNWNFMCAECHSTNVKKNYDADPATVHHVLDRHQRELRGVPWGGVGACDVGGEASRRAGQASGRARWGWWSSSMSGTA